MMPLPDDHQPHGFEDLEDYDLLDRLERLETLHEEMVELGVLSLNDVDRQIEEIQRILDDRED